MIPSQDIITRNFSIFEEMKKFYYKSSAKTCLKWARCLWFPTSDCLKTWLIPSGTTRSRQYYESTMVWSSCPRITTFGSLSCPFGQKSVTKRRKHCQRWYKGRLRRTMVDSWYCLDQVFPEGMIGNHGRHGREPSTAHSQSLAIWHFCTHITNFSWSHCDTEKLDTVSGDDMVLGVL